MSGRRTISWPVKVFEVELSIKVRDPSLIPIVLVNPNRSFVIRRYEHFPVKAATAKFAEIRFLERNLAAGRHKKGDYAELDTTVRDGDTHLRRDRPAAWIGAANRIDVSPPNCRADFSRR